MSRLTQKRENNAIFKQKYTPKLFITFKMAYFDVSVGEGEILDFLL